jgi:hypothetical protein
MLTELQNTIANLEARLKATHLIAEDAKSTATKLHDAQVANDATVQKGKRKGNAKRARTQVSSLLIAFRIHKYSPSIQALVHEKMQWALGLGRTVDNEVIKSLPLPLKRNELPELLADGKTERAHPNWRCGVSDPYNNRFCGRIAGLVMDHISQDRVWFWTLTADYWLIPP